MAKGQELAELVDGVMELLLLVLEKVKNGSDLGKEVPAIIEKLQKDPVYLEAVEGITDIPTEVKSYSRWDCLKLFGKVFSYVPRIVEIYYKKKG